MFLRIRSLPGLLAALATFVVPWASASLVRLDATAKPGPDGSFSLVFDDTGDGIFEFSELVSFSGLSYFGASLDILAGPAVVPNISAAGGSCAAYTSVPSWCFASSSDGVLQVASAANWTYALTPLDATVTKPSALALAGLALAGMGWTMRAGRRPVAAAPRE